MDRPDLKFTVKIGEEERTIKWTYGLSADLQRFIPDAEAVLKAGALNDPVIRDFMVRRLLPDKKGTITDPDQLISEEEIEDLDPDAVLALIDWGSKHLVYFFTRSMTLLKEQGGILGDHLQSLIPPSTGSPSSPSETA